MPGETTTKPTQTLDFEARLAAEDSAGGEEGRSFAVAGNELDNYVGVAPEYQTYANETEKPYRADGGAESVFEERAIESAASINDKPAVGGKLAQRNADRLAAEQEKVEEPKAEKPKAEKPKSEEPAGKPAGAPTSGGAPTKE